MNKLINLVLILFLSSLIVVNAQENVTDTDPGITPDNFLWGLDKAIDQISLLLTTSPDAKASKGLEIAQERLAEIKLRVEENKIEAAQKAEEDHNSLLNVVKESVSNINETNSSNTIKKIIKIEKELENQENEIERVNDKIKIKGTLTAEQKNLLQAFLNSLDNSTQQVKLEINEKKNEVKVKLKQETEKSDEEIEQEIDDEENDQGLTDALKEKAQEKISDLKQKIEELRNMNSATKEFVEATDFLEQAQSEFERGNYRVAINIAKEGKNKLESIEENDEEEGNNNNNEKNEFENEKENNNENNKGENTNDETE